MPEKRPYTPRIDFVNPPERGEHVNLYGIVGWMTTKAGWFEPDYWITITGDKVAAFGGYLKQDPMDHSFEGQLVDIHGESLIKGEMKEDELSFKKTYKNGPSIDASIQYKFRLRNGLWIGEYDFSQLGSTMRGRSQCQTTLVFQNASRIATDHFMEDYFQDPRFRFAHAE